MISECIKEYLLINRLISLPGIGVLQLKSQNAAIDKSNDFFSPPADSLSFHYSKIEYNNSNFEEFVSEKHSIDLVKAKNKINQFFNSLSFELNNKGVAKIENLGYFLIEGTKVVFKESENKKDFKKKNFGLNVFEFSKGREHIRKKKNLFFKISMFVGLVLVSSIFLFYPKTNFISEQKEKPVVVASNSGLIFYIIAGTYSDKVNADRMKEILQRNGYQASVVYYRKYYRVSFQSFDNKRDAERQLKHIKQNTNTKDCWILEMAKSTM